MLQPDQKALIRRTFAQIQRIGPVATALCYSRLFELASVVYDDQPVDA